VGTIKSMVSFDSHKLIDYCYNRWYVWQLNVNEVTSFQPQLCCLLTGDGGMEMSLTKLCNVQFAIYPGGNCCWY